MPSEAAKYLQYARECVRLADRTPGEEQRDKLLALARVWMDAAMTEEELAGISIKPARASGEAGRRGHKSDVANEGPGARHSGLP